MFMAAGVLGARDVDWTLGNVFNLADALKTISGTVEWLSSSLWAMGVVLAYYLPAVPVIAWVTGVIRWLAGVAEAVLAAPLMAASMVHPEGHEIAGKSGAGWMLILSMILQPALLVLGLIIGILMTYPAGALVNSMFLQMVVGATGNDGLGLVGIVAWTAIYVLMMSLAIHSCFALISAVPDGVMRYIAAQVGATNVVKTADDATQRFEGGAGGAGKGLGGGGIPKDPRNRDSSPGAGGPENSISNAEHHSNRDLLGG
jgi:conjugal transfer/type IV secretion protein DotA/TraY